MSKFQYLGGVIPFAFVVVFLLSVIVYFLYQHSLCCLKNRDFLQENGTNLSLFQKYFYGQSYESVYQSRLRRIFGHTQSLLILACWRLGCFCYFFGVVFLWGYIREDGGNAQYFTLWNVNLITLFFFLVSIASFIGIYSDQAFQGQTLNGHSKDLSKTLSTFWSDSLMKFGYAIQILYEIAGSTVFFITVVAFATLNPHFVFWNVNVHFMTSMSLLVELCLNQMVVRWEHVLFTIYWALMYLIFIWPIVAIGDIHDWPYFFLKTDTAAVFPWYIGLFSAQVLFYYLFWSFSYGKFLLIERMDEEHRQHPPLIASEDRRQQNSSLYAFETQAPQIPSNYF